MGRDCYIYQADVYCEACTNAIKKRLKAAGKRPATYKDETTYDSDEWPKGPHSDQESDTPDHCGSGEHCLDPITLPDGRKVGCWLENPLTKDGVAYAREHVRDDPDSPVVKLWQTYYAEELRMTTDEKREEVIRRKATSIIYDAEHSSSYEQEIYRLVHSGNPVEQWTEDELDAYLAEHDKDGNAIDPPPAGDGTEMSFHFDVGNSIEGPLGLCARVTAGSREKALEILRKALPEDYELELDFADGRIAYVNVYLNADKITLADIDDEEPADVSGDATTEDEE